MLKTKFDKGIWFTGMGTVLAVLALLLVWDITIRLYYPTADLQSSLTLANSCSSQFTLRVMFCFLPGSVCSCVYLLCLEVLIYIRLVKRNEKMEDTHIR